MKGQSNGAGCSVDGTNILHLALGCIPDDAEILRKLKRLPPKPSADINQTLIGRNYELGRIRSIRAPSADMLTVARTIDLMLHEGYMERNPFNPTVWRSFFSEISSPLAAEPGPAAFVIGASGLGKTKCIQRVLEGYTQVYVHPEFPNCTGGLTQLCWLYIQMPPSGNLKSLLAALIDATAFAFKDPEVLQLLTISNRDLHGSLQNWVRFVQTHFLGLLVIDEVQNLFKLPSIEQRRSKRGRKELDLRLSDDVTLKTLMEIIEESGVPLMLVGTPDASAILQKRFAVSQRLTTGGQIEFRHAENFESPDFNMLLKTLEMYQWSDVRLAIDDELKKFIHSVTAGIRRLVISLWIAAHRVAIASGSRNLTMKHFEMAAAGSLAPTRPAVDALLSGHPDAVRRFEDLFYDSDWRPE
ncbi:ATP-binding protein [Stenotrophobium rhamnosiphilum]|uniref:ORC1/DEAH AAA+ ATPase domain-containing protein n=1 Tax=Stenotrophobium rhamnosiphilum TaxID=2029166 RepID=A0A2T5MCK5_9GAMM|nr:ATP-binding protein [Stenotrophobium rhamnosiphilum]PTU30306.1 hypothetical protein CJD38_15280 [Stenotrophobium rhamnosiphilum]